MNRLALVSFALLLAGVASAQEGSPRGPAEIIKQVGAARAAREQKILGQPTRPDPPSEPSLEPPPQQAPTGMEARPAELPPGHPSVDDADDEQPPVGDDPHAHAEGAPPLARRQLATAEPSSSVPVGTIRVRVLDANERPVAGAELQLGTMAQPNTRTSVAARSGGDGIHAFDKLATGEGQAYRVNVVHDGAKYSSTPFRLPADRGYDVTIRQLDTTRDARDVVLYVGATSIELRDDRLKIVQQARLVNIGSKAYVFPDEGQLVKLPKGVLTFQAEEVMTDQHMREDKGQGMRITGSLPPGEVTLTWGFDLPQQDSTLDLSFDLPWITFAYRVLADAAPGMTLDVDGMPAAELHEDNGRRFYVTELVKRVGDQPLRAIAIHLRGIPGPGPMRFIAVGLALLILGVGVYVARSSGSAEESSPLGELARQRERLVERAAELEAERVRGEIGPEFHADAMRDLEEELAAVLYEEKRVGTNNAGKAAG